MRKMMIAAAVALGISSVPASAQQSGLVNVNLSDIQVDLQNILSNNNVNVSVPVSVALPIGVAAQVCGVNAAVLAHQDAAQGCTGSVVNDQTARAVARAIQSAGG